VFGPGRTPPRWVTIIVGEARTCCRPPAKKRTPWAATEARQPGSHQLIAQQQMPLLAEPGNTRSACRCSWMKLELEPSELCEPRSSAKNGARTAPRRGSPWGPKRGSTSGTSSRRYAHRDATPLRAAGRWCAHRVHGHTCCQLPVTSVTLGPTDRVCVVTSRGRAVRTVPARVSFSTAGSRSARVRLRRLYLVTCAACTSTLKLWPRVLMRRPQIQCAARPGVGGVTAPKE